ncbi:MAG TPA: ABC transporter permease [Rectinemataceae bacterium]|nr:ABC transporter permease [Rectinemataceae bacterium]
MGRIKQSVSGGRTPWQEAWIRFKRNKLAMAGLALIVVLIIVSLATIAIDLIDGGATYAKYVIKQNFRNKLAPPSLQHIFGCDEFGRSILFRMIWGTRYSLFVGVVAIVIATLTGGIFGAIAGYYGGRIDNLIMRFMDVFLAIPSMVLAIAVVAALGTSMFNLLLSIAVPQIPRFARIVRASVMSVRDKEFIEASKAVGANDFVIITKYIIPNAMAPIIVQTTLGTANAILSIAGLSYLGLGIQPPTPEWGAILTSAKMYMRDAWHISVIPGLGIMLTILALNLFGDGLRDAFDPKLKK